MDCDLTVFVDGVVDMDAVSDRFGRGKLKSPHNLITQPSTTMTRASNGGSLASDGITSVDDGGGVGVRHKGNLLVEWIWFRGF